MRREKGIHERFYTTLDAYQAAWLTLRNHFPDLVDQNGKVVFAFIHSEQLLKDLTDYHAGGIVEAARFAFAVKTLKSQIHSLRKNKENSWQKDLREQF